MTHSLTPAVPSRCARPGAWPAGRTLALVAAACLAACGDTGDAEVADSLGTRAFAVEEEIVWRFAGDPTAREAWLPPEPAAPPRPELEARAVDHPPYVAPAPVAPCTTDRVAPREPGGYVELPDLHVRFDELREPRLPTEGTRLPPPPPAELRRATELVRAEVAGRDLDEETRAAEKLAGLVAAEHAYFARHDPARVGLDPASASAEESR
jgi:hypothetical protein